MACNMERSRNKAQPYIATRDREELEGAPLLPIASSVSLGYNESAGAQFSMALFADEARHNLNHSQMDPVGVTSIDGIDHYNSLPLAPSLPMYDTVEAMERSMQHKVAIAERRGLELAELEKEKIQKARRDIFAINYRADQEIQRANQLAQKRNQVGVEIERDSWFGSETSQRNSKDRETAERAFQVPRDGGGYQVAEYKINDYCLDQHYNISEYKSVYD